MELTLCILYPLIFLVQLVLLIFAVRKPEKKLWPALFWLEVLSLLGTIGMMVLFELLPGGGPMPGLTWFAEFFYSLFAAVAYLAMLLISCVALAIQTWRRH